MGKKVQVDAEYLGRLHAHASRVGTLTQWSTIAMEFAVAAEARIAELEAVAEAADANNVSRILIKYANFHPQWKALADALRAAGYLSE